MKTMALVGRRSCIIAFAIAVVLTLLVGRRMVQADGGYAGIFVRYAGMVRPQRGLADYTGTCITNQYSTVWRGDYNCGAEGSGSHEGVDISQGACGTQVRAVGEGEIIAVVNNWNPGANPCANNTQFGASWGNYVVVRHDHVPTANGYGGTAYSIYAHLRDVKPGVAVGRKVLRGTIIGTQGSTGNSTGPHLHFQMDRDNVAIHPYNFPGDANTPDPNNEVGQHTFSPVRFIQDAHEVKTQFTGNGAWAQYYGNTILAPPSIEEFYETEIDHEWFNGGPAFINPPDNFSARWVGDIYLPTTGWWVFLVTTDDGVKLWVDGNGDGDFNDSGEFVLDRWIGQPSTTYASPRWRSAGTHRVKLEFYEAYGDATIQLAWKQPSQTLLSSGWEDGQNWGNANVIQYRNWVNGWYGNDNPPPECSRVTGEVTLLGSGSLRIAGKDMSTTQNSYCYYRLFDNNLFISSGTQIVYWIYHHTEWGEPPNTTRHVAVDGHTTDGLTIRDFNNGAIKDNFGVRIHPMHRVDPVTQWYRVDVDLSRMAGKTLDFIMFGYDDNQVSEEGRYRGYVDQFFVINP